jgi:DNA (cytosine-5)-methyltransferase 1
MKVGSLFSGIEGFGLGFEEAGWEIAWQVESEPFCLAVLKTHWPSVQRFTDVRSVGRHNLEKVDCITAGVPCQDVSVAGKRAGLSGERTGLFYEFARILSELRPAWFVFENVPGLFSSNHGRDFAEVLRVLMVECGYGVSWRVLDSRYFNVAQRRERVFIVGCLGKPCPAEILFESESGERNPSQSGEARQDIAVPLTSGSGVTGNDPGRRCEDDFNLVYRMQAFGQYEASASASKERDWKDATDLVVGPLNTRNGHSINAEDAAGNHIVAATLRESDGHHGRSSPRGDGCDNLVAFAENQRGELRTSEIAPQLSAGGGKPGSGYSAVAYALREDPGGTGQAHNCTCVIDEERSGVVEQPAGKVDGAMQRNADDGQEAHADRVRGLAGIPYRLDLPNRTVIFDGKELRKVWCSICKKKKAFRSPPSHLRVHEATLLQCGMCADCVNKTQSIVGRWKEMGTEAHRSEEMCGLRNDEELEQGPRRRESLEQFSRERGNSMPQLPHEERMEAGEVQEHWQMEACFCADSPRYRALGNAVTKTVAYWIAKRLMEAASA